MSRSDTRFLEVHGGKYRVTVPVPRQFQKAVGKTKLKRPLKTDSLVVANTLKWKVVAELKKQIHLAARATPADPLLEEALIMREALENDTSEGGPDDFTVMDAIHLRADQLAGDPIDEDPYTREPIYDSEREALAGFYFKVATGKGTPLTALLDQWHRQQINRKERTKGDDVRALKYLLDWCKANGIYPTIEAIKRKVAGRFIGDLPDIAASARNGQRLTNRTANKYISSLSAYWKWLKTRDMVAENVWRDQFLPKERVAPEDRERPFNDEEVQALLAGSPSMTALGSLMRIAALSGARIDAIVSLKVKHCENGLFRFKPQKKEAGERYVPIHSALVPLIETLKRGKAPDDDLFDGFPVPEPGSQRERSMPAVKAFGRYRVALGIDERREGRKRSLINFHSFRRWFITKAERAGIPEATIASVVGHKRPGMTFGVYSAGPGLELLRHCVEAVKLP